MADKKILSYEQRIYYAPVITKIMEYLQDGEEHYTFEFCKLSSSIRTKQDAPILRKILRTLESEGRITNIDNGFNQHK